MSRLKSHSHKEIYIVLFLFIMILGSNSIVFAKSKEIELQGKAYEFDDGSQYAFEDSLPNENGFFYGDNSLGSFSISGDIGIETKYNGVNAYEANGKISFNYKYDGKYLDDSNKKKWYLDDSHDEIVNGIDTTDSLLLQDKINTGVIIIQKSKDRQKWKLTGNIYNDFFDENKKGKKGLYKATKEDTINGLYYRIIVAYQLKRRIKKGEFLSPEEFEFKECAEVYEFYICANKNPVRIHDITSRKDITSPSQAKAFEGFYIDRNGSENSISVSADNYQNQLLENKSSYTEKGKYTVTVETKLGRRYTYNVVVTEGLNLTELSSKVYSSDEDDGFPTKRENYDKTSNPVSSLKIGVPPDSRLTVKGNNYSVVSSGVGLFMSLSTQKIRKDGWSVISDSWGKKESQKVGGVHLGQLGKGAVLVQTSKDGKKWKHSKKAGYAEGFKNIDILTHYGVDKDFLLYTPDGKEILEGLYIRVLFAYQVQQKGTKKIQDRVEKYTFYLCSNNLGAVTIHNRTIRAKLKEYIGEQDETTLEVYRSAENMLSESGTVTGFSVDTSNNPSADYSVIRDGKEIPKSDDYTKTGRYDITISNNAGETENRTIFIDRLSAKAALKLYFGEWFIQGKRIYSEGAYPVFEGGESTYHLEEVPDNFLPIMGRITNITTGESIDISYSREARSGKLVSAGEYVAVFFTQKYEIKDTTNETEETEIDNNLNSISGDVREFTFHFSIIPEGTAPGPVLNERNLEEYDRKAITDCYPIYYSLKRHSSSKGDIRIAFSNEADAQDYAYKYESGTVEKQKDGTYRYRGAFQTAQKEVYDSSWDLADAIEYFAKQAVTKFYFDLSDPFTYRTLDPEIEEDIESLQAEKLSDSIVYFEDGQLEQLTDKESLPIINNKSYAILNPEKDPQTSEMEKGFEFKKDDHGYDSEKVTITDSAGKEIAIEYGKNVDDQLVAAGCKTGIVTIKEVTCYGDINTYEAVFFNKGDNTSTITLSCMEGADKKTVAVDQDHSKTTKLIVDSFSVESVEDLLDPYNLVIVKRQGDEETFFCADQIVDYKYLIPGIYNIKVVNRLGYSYSFNVEIPEERKQTESASEMKAIETEKEDLSLGNATPVETVKESDETVKEGSTDETRLSVQQNEKENDAAETEQKDSGSSTMPIVVVVLLIIVASGAAAFLFRRKAR